MKETVSALLTSISGPAVRAETPLARFMKSLMVIAAYLIAVAMGASVTTIPQLITPIWPPPGMALVFLLFCGWRIWPVLLTAATLAVTLFFMAHGGFAGGSWTVTFGISAIIASGEIAEASLNYYLLSRFADGAGFMKSFRGVFRFFVIAGMISPIVSATVGSICVTQAGFSATGDLPLIWWSWWQADAIGVLLCAPAAMAWLSIPDRDCERRSWTEAAALVACLVAASLIVFSSWSSTAREAYPLAFLLLPLLVWAAARFGLRGATGASVLISTVAIVGTVQGFGPFASVSLPQSFLILGAFIGVVSLTGMSVAALTLERSSAIRTLGRSEERFRRLSAATFEALAITQNGEFIDVNDEFTRLFGYERQDIVGKRVLQCEASEFYGLPIRKPRDPNQAVECPCTHRDGTRFWAEVRGKEIPGDGSGARVTAIRDITERKQAEQQVQKAAAALEASNQALQQANAAAGAATRAKSEFLANMSHEIRTPLTAILGFAETLLESDLKDEERNRAVQTIHRNGEYLLGLINDILDLSKIEAGRMTVERLPCSIRRMLNDVADLIWVRTEAKGLTLKIDFVSDIPDVILTDPTRLRQILINLVSNAVKFTEAGGVRMIVHCLKRADDDPLLQVDILDTGIGMNEEQFGRLFQAFSQADGSMARKFGGTGLGLTLSKKLAQLLGGDVVLVETQAGKGTRFRATIRAGVAAKSETESAAGNTSGRPSTDTPQDVAPLAGHRILLAEDGEDNQRLLTHILNKEGVQLTVVGNGEEAVKTALDAVETPQAFDCILMDMQMPVMDGYEATRQLRERGCTTPIIALTAHAMATDREKCLQAGCDEYATKPVNRRRLIETIGRQLSRHNEGVVI